jgi:mono/diheme cytochrome c family protein
MSTTPNNRRRSARVGLIATSVAALTLAACGGGASSSPDLANGKNKFNGACGGCHTLADAGTTGKIGPNLDDAFRGPREEGFKTTAFEGIIRYWIQKPEQVTEPVMPADLVTGKDAEDVAAYIAAKAGIGPEDSPARPAEEFK